MEKFPNILKEKSLNESVEFGITPRGNRPTQEPRCALPTSATVELRKRNSEAVFWAREVDRVYSGEGVCMRSIDTQL